MDIDRVVVFDTTLRDGEQSPGASLGIEEKLQIARQLARLNVDVIEAGFPVSSPAQFEAVRLIAQQVRGPVIAGLARAVKLDIDRCWEAVRYAPRPRIHTFIATSDIHLKYKLRMSRQEVLDRAVEAVKLARGYTEDVEFSAEDAGRTDPGYLCQVVEAVIDAGATTVNIPDTVGYMIPEEFAALIRKLYQSVPNIDQVTLSVHCHNDLGLATANSLAGVKAGARQVECTINGLGERAGNASLEEVVMAINTRQDFMGVSTSVETTEIYRTSQMVSKLTGLEVQANKAIVGANAFAHEAGIHQDGVLKEKSTYEIMTPQSIGLERSRLVLGRHSGRHGFKARLEEMGYRLSDEMLEKTYQRFLLLADKKKEVFDEDLVAIVEDETVRVPERYKLEYLHSSSGTGTVPTATVRIRMGEEVFQEASCGDGPVDATYKAIDRLVKLPINLREYSIRAVTSGAEAMGEVTVKIDDDGAIVIGRAASTDIIEASAKAYINVINKLVARRKAAGGAGKSK